MCCRKRGYLWLTTLWPDMSRVGLSWWTTLRWMGHGYRGRSSWRINCLSGSMGILTRRPSRLEKPLYLSQHEPGDGRRGLCESFLRPSFLEAVSRSFRRESSLGAEGKKKESLWPKQENTRILFQHEIFEPLVVASRNPGIHLCTRCRGWRG